jgi:hypothetical protein
VSVIDHSGRAERDRPVQAAWRVPHGVPPGVAREAVEWLD